MHIKHDLEHKNRNVFWHKNLLFFLGSIAISMMVEADLCTPRPSGILQNLHVNFLLKLQSPNYRVPQSFFFNTDHQLEAVNATPLYPKPLITALADMKIILLFDKILKTFQMN